jgi:membrane protein implicated in regulation of membrane protease activity
MEWWMWVVGGLALTVLEVATPSGFFIIFFGLGALTVGVLAGLSIVEVWWMQWLLFTVLSVVYLLLFRGRLQSRFQMPPTGKMDQIVGVLAVAQVRILPGEVGRVEVRGAAWSARNTSASPLETGQRCRVASMEGLLLTVVPE